MSKIMVHCYHTYESINQFEIGYMINPSLNCNKVFRVKYEKWLSVSLHEKKMETIKDFLRKNNTCVVLIIMFYENNGENKKSV